jgi:hypothetical protein
MKNLELESILIKKCEVLNLEENAFTLFKNIFAQNSITELNEIFGDLNRESICLKFKNYSFYIAENKTSIRTRLSIQTLQNDEIGWYEIETDFDGEFLDEFLNLY